MIKPTIPKKKDDNSVATNNNKRNKQPMEWNNYLTDHDKFKISKEKMLWKKKLIVSKNNVLLQENSTSPKFTRTNFRKVRREATAIARSKQNSDGNSNCNSRNHSRSRSPGFSRERQRDGHHDRDSEMTSLDLLANLSDDDSNGDYNSDRDSDRVRDEDRDSETSDQDNGNHRNNILGRDSSRHSPTYTSKNNKNNSSPIIDGKQPIHVSINKKKQQTEPKPVSNRGNRTLTRDSKTSSRVITTSPLTWINNNSQRKRDNYKDTERLDPQELNDMCIQIRSLQEELLYYEQLSGKKSALLDAEELDMLLPVDENGEHGISQSTVMKYLVQLVCHTMTYLLKSEVDLQSEKAKFSQLNHKVDSLIAMLANGSPRSIQDYTSLTGLDKDTITTPSASSDQNITKRAQTATQPVLVHATPEKLSFAIGHAHDKFNRTAGDSNSHAIVHDYSSKIQWSSNADSLGRESERTKDLFNYRYAAQTTDHSIYNSNADTDVSFSSTGNLSGTSASDWLFKSELSNNSNKTTPNLMVHSLTPMKSKPFLYNSAAGRYHLADSVTTNSQQSLPPPPPPSLDEVQSSGKENKKVDNKYSDFYHMSSPSLELFTQTPSSLSKQWSKPTNTASDLKKISDLISPIRMNPDEVRRSQSLFETQMDSANHYQSAADTTATHLYIDGDSNYYGNDMDETGYYNYNESSVNTTATKNMFATEEAVSIINPHTVSPTPASAPKHPFDRDLTSTKNSKERETKVRFNLDGSIKDDFPKKLVFDATLGSF